jgi:putative Mg2+ transporter-C (MgtC) family protein
VRGLTTAAIVWVTAAVGMACGAGLALLACATTAGHFAVVLGYPAIGESTRRGFAVQRVTTQQLGAGTVGGVAAVAVTLEVHGQPDVQGLVTTLDELPGVLEVTTTELGRDAD